MYLLGCCVLPFHLKLKVPHLYWLKTGMCCQLTQVVSHWPRNLTLSRSHSTQPSWVSNILNYLSYGVNLRNKSRKKFKPFAWIAKNPSPVCPHLLVLLPALFSKQMKLSSLAHCTTPSASPGTNLPSHKDCCLLPECLPSRRERKRKWPRTTKERCLMIELHPKKWLSQYKQSR